MKNEELRIKNEGGNSLRGVSVKHNRLLSGETHGR